MKHSMLFCGTGAADYEKPQEGCEFRKFCHTLLDNELLIDMGLNAYWFEDEDVLRKRFSSVKNVLVTHTHIDHFHLPSLERLAADNGHISVYLDSVACRRMPEQENIAFFPLENGKDYTIGDVCVHVFPSHHKVSDPEEPTHHYLITFPDGKRVFYGLDGAWLHESVYYYLKEHPVDVMVLDCTVGRIKGDFRIFEHNSIPMLALMMETIRSEHLLKEGGVVYADHLARTLHPGHNAVAADLRENLQMETAYDGLCIEF